MDVTKPIVYVEQKPHIQCFAKVLCVFSVCTRIHSKPLQTATYHYLLVPLLVVLSVLESATKKTTKPLQNAQSRALRFGERGKKPTKPLQHDQRRTLHFGERDGKPTKP